MGAVSFKWTAWKPLAALSASLLCAAAPEPAPRVLPEMNVESAVLTATGYHVVARSVVSGGTGPDYVGPGVGGWGCMAPDPPAENFEEPLRSAVSRDRKATSIPPLPAFGDVSQRLALVSPGENHSVTAYMTVVSQAPDEVERAYYHGILARCYGNKLGDARFLVSGVHVQLTDYCGGTVFDIAAVLRRIDDLVHPRWLVVAECGGGSLVSSPLVRAAGLLPMFQFGKESRPGTTRPP